MILDMMHTEDPPDHIFHSENYSKNIALLEKKVNSYLHF